MNLSVGYLHASIKLLDLFLSKPVRSFEKKPKGQDLFNLCDLTTILSLCEKCKWLDKVRHDRFQITDKGLLIAREKDHEAKMRRQLKDFILIDQPIWSMVMHYGRAEFAYTAPPNIIQCFSESKLFTDNPDDDIVKWWDEVSGFVRSCGNDGLNDIGRKGERLTIEYELKRTGVIPKWQALDSNFSGYDILSVVSREDRTPMQIEVKTTTNMISFANLIITKNEWKQATNAIAHKFYIWHIDKQSELAVLSVDELGEHIPCDQGKGLWKTAEIPLRVFDQKFQQLT